MTEDYDGLLIVETFEELEKPEPRGKNGCMTVMALLVALMLLFSAAVPLTRFIIRKSYERQVEEFPQTVCENLTKAGQTELVCDASLGIVEFVPTTLRLGTTKDDVALAMRGLPFEEQSGLSQPACQRPTLWTYSVAKSSLGWKTEIEFLFCSDMLVERIVLVNGAPVSLPTYDL